MFSLILSQLVKMLLMMLLAFCLFRWKVVNQEGNRTLSTLLLTVVNPIVIITVYQTEYNPDLVSGLFTAFGCAVCAHIIAILISMILIRKKEGSEWALERYAAVYSNCGFIGIPLVSSVLGDTGVFFLTAYMAIFNLFVWTHGLLLLKGSFSRKQLKEGFTSPMFLATWAAMLLFFLKIRFPQTVLDSLNYIADMNTPMAMLIAGFSVAQADLKKLLLSFRIYRVSFVKLLAVPFAVLLFLTALHIHSDIAYPILIASACPVAATLNMMAIRYEKNYTYAAELFSFTTVLSVITIPVLSYAAGFLIH